MFILINEYIHLLPVQFKKFLSVQFVTFLAGVLLAISLNIRLLKNWKALHLENVIDVNFLKHLRQKHI